MEEPTLCLSVQEILSVSKESLPNYEQKIKSFYEEHIHEDEEIRYILDGCGELQGHSTMHSLLLCALGALSVAPKHLLTQGPHLVHSILQCRVL